jgi:hypothetical protein
MNEYTFSYRHNGKEWSLNYYADDWEDAQRKLQSIKTNATFTGEIVASLPLPISSKFISWLKKWHGG